MDDAQQGEFAGLSNKALIAEITTLAGHLNAANHRWLVLIAEFDRRKAWSDGLTLSCAHWLSWKCNLDLGAARERVRVARALVSLPKISEAMSEGRLSYCVVRALTRIATPENESALLQWALHGTVHQIEELVRKWRRVQEVEELTRAERQEANRKLTYRFDEDGSVHVHLSLPPEAGLVFKRAIEAAQAEVHGDDPSNLADVSPETSRALRMQRRADAAIVLAESFLAHGPEALKGGDRQHIVVHVDQRMLQGHQSGRCELDDGPAIAIETARRLSCDASRLEITETERGEPLDVGRKTRTIPPAMHRALRARDQCCVFPGCTHRRYVDGHHVHHWADGGATKLSNLVLLCRFHHRAVHEGGWHIHGLDDGAWRFVSPDGECIGEEVSGETSTHWTDLKEHNLARGVFVDPCTARTGWRGERIDYGLAVEILDQRRKWRPSPRCVDLSRERER